MDNISKGPLFSTGFIVAAGCGALLWYLISKWRFGEAEDKSSDRRYTSLSILQQLNEYTKLRFHSTIPIVVESRFDWENAFALIKPELGKFGALGLDCEWVTRDRKRQPVSMLQLSTLNVTVLVRLPHPDDLIPCQLGFLDEVGVGIIEDRDKLWQDYELELRGCVDLRHMATRIRKAWTGLGLKALAEQIADMELDKSDLLRRGDWEAEQLSTSMQRYAARDSQAGLAIFMSLVAHKLPADSQLNADDEDELLEAIKRRAPPLCQGIIDLNYKYSGIKKSSTAVDSLKAEPTVKKAVSTNALRSRVMYSNCFMQAPDGQVLCVCDAKKAQWYCDKGLAEWVSAEDDDELVIRLKFEPRGRPSGERDYYRSRKENICVVCGADKSFIRKNIVPREYRKHFPEILKSHSSHDVVLLCASCHKTSSIYDQQYKDHFAKLCDAPYKSGAVAVDDDLKRVKSAARALRGYADRLPPEKKDEFTGVLEDYYNTPLTDELVHRACELDDRNDPSEAHSRKVVDYYQEKESIQAFQKLWRQRFVDVMQPKHMAETWDIDYDHMDYLWVK